MLQVDIETKAIDENSATCVTDKLGTYAIVAELVELPEDFEAGAVFLLRMMMYQKMGVLSRKPMNIFPSLLPSPLIPSSLF